MYDTIPQEPASSTALTAPAAVAALHAAQLATLGQALAEKGSV